MKIQITAEGDSAKTEMLGEGQAREVEKIIFQMDLLRFKLLRMLDDNSEGGSMMYQRKGEGEDWGDKSEL